MSARVSAGTRRSCSALTARAAIVGVSARARAIRSAGAGAIVFTSLFTSWVACMAFSASDHFKEMWAMTIANFRQTSISVPSTTGRSARRAGPAQSELVLPKADLEPVEPIDVASSVVIAPEPLARSVAVANEADIGVDAELAVLMRVACAGPVAGVRARDRSGRDRDGNGGPSWSPG